MSADWGSDVPVSMPEPLDRDGVVPMFGFVFTVDGLRHDISAEAHERLSRPPLAPISPANTDWGDSDVG